MKRQKLRVNKPRTHALLQECYKNYNRFEQAWQGI